MMQVVNSIQLVVVFILFPWLIQWLYGSGFVGSVPISYLLGMVYVWMFYLAVIAVYDQLSKIDFKSRR